MPDQSQMTKRQQVLADFGEFALHSESLDEVLTEACRLVAGALDIDRAKILEILEGGQELLVRAGVGWEPGIVGHLRLSMSEASSESFSIQAAKPVVSQDIRDEDRFEVPDFMKEAGVVALANVPIFVPGGRAYGLLQVDATRPREFAEEDTQFLRTYATILGYRSNIPVRLSKKPHALRARGRVIGSKVRSRGRDGAQDQFALIIFVHNHI